MASDFETAVLTQLGEIKAIAATAAAKTASLETRLFNGGSGVIQILQSDISELKSDRKEDEKWEKIHNILHYSLSPILITGHIIARKLGINV